MLSEEEKKRIELVETYKFEVKDKLEYQKARKFGLGMVYSFFNSKFGLWVLSAIFVSGGVKVYDDYKVKQENEKTRGEIIEKLDNEISFKFDRVLASLELIKEKEPEGVWDQEFSTLEEAKNFALGINKDSGKEEKYLYEEFKNWSLLALMVEQNRQLKHLGIQDTELEEVIRQLNEMAKIFENRQVNYEDIKSIQKIIRENLVLSRWKSNSLFSD
ncbi:hypothetical protein SAMN00777080_1930 [Aquiflexum balticum DSM 16537]|uniref:Uncharacterized protein n=1 Tax=Aquiflexum balticum DSM 16537 TaxID=758820 RepID=A0A1W2H330_9BACT|nr:hypothetical protein [Aquiflexum balticum]SMD43340.1 hypothetical protein SAMN00777080_1930 [Aquiflexum balticum DSM 16537]